MSRVSFTDNLKRHVACPPQDVSGATVRARWAAGPLLAAGECVRVAVDGAVRVFPRS